MLASLAICKKHNTKQKICHFLKFLRIFQFFLTLNGIKSRFFRKNNRKKYIRKKASPLFMYVFAHTKGKAFIRIVNGFFQLFLEVSLSYDFTREFAQFCTEIKIIFNRIIRDFESFEVLPFFNRRRNSI